MVDTVREEVHFDVAAFAKRLRELTSTALEVRHCRRASTGYANSTWLIDAEPADLVVKVQVEPTFVYKRDPALEPAVLDGLLGTQVLVPRVVARDQRTDLFGAPWFAMERMNGTSVPDEGLTGYAATGWFVDADAGLRTRLWNGFVDQLAALHRLPADVFGSHRRGGSHAAMLDYWSRSLIDVVDSSMVPEQERALAWLKANAPDDADDASPCMGDAKLANVLQRDGEVVALIDWELAHIGNPRGDLAYMLHVDAGYATVAGRRLSGLPSPDETWARWEERSGLSAHDRAYWELFATTWMAITSTRAMLLAHGIDGADVEAVNPSVPDIRLLLDR